MVLPWRIWRSVTFRLGVAPLPYYDDFNNAPYNTLIGGAALWVMAGKSAPEYAGVARFLQFIASPENAAAWHRNTGYIATTRSGWAALEKSGYYREHPEMAIAHTGPRPQSDWAGSFQVRIVGQFPAARSAGSASVLWDCGRHCRTAADKLPRQ